MDNKTNISIRNEQGEIVGTEYFSRIGVSETLFTDREGNIFMKAGSRQLQYPSAELGGRKYHLNLRDEQGGCYIPSCWADDADKSGFYQMNRPLIEKRIEKLRRLDLPDMIIQS